METSDYILSYLIDVSKDIGVTMKPLSAEEIYLFKEKEIMLK